MNLYPVDLQSNALPLLYNLQGLLQYNNDTFQQFCKQQTHSNNNESTMYRISACLSALCQQNALGTRLLYILAFKPPKQANLFLSSYSECVLPPTSSLMLHNSLNYPPPPTAQSTVPRGAIPFPPPVPSSHSLPFTPSSLHAPSPLPWSPCGPTNCPHSPMEVCLCSTRQTSPPRHLLSTRPAVVHTLPVRQNNRSSDPVTHTGQRLHSHPWSN